MPDKDSLIDYPQKQSEIDKLNAKLSDSIGRCRTILDDCRSRLAANSDVGDEGFALPAEETGTPE